MQKVIWVIVTLCVSFGVSAKEYPNGKYSCATVNTTAKPKNPDGSYRDYHATNTIIKSDEGYLVKRGPVTTKDVFLKNIRTLSVTAAGTPGVIMTISDDGLGQPMFKTVSFDKNEKPRLTLLMFDCSLKSK